MKLLKPKQRTMKKVLIVSLVLNILFVFLFASYVYKHREETIQKILHKKQHATIVMFGDSHVANGNWSFLLKRYDIKRSGHGGFTSEQLLNLINEDVIKYNPEICFFQLGGNDIRSKGYSIYSVTENFSRLITCLQNHNIKPVAQSLFFRLEDNLYNSVVDSINHRLLTLCRERNIDYLDINSDLNDDGINADHFEMDGTHLSKSGYKVWSTNLRKYLSDQGF